MVSSWYHNEDWSGKAEKEAAWTSPSCSSQKSGNLGHVPARLLAARRAERHVW